ncbi:MAG: chemotaxis protein CheX [Defluviitaleaceae bacterium]|nr:chemotaxis protein CheX [Defluviitaleaceae bacterium]
MKVEIVNSFVQGAQSTLTTLCGQMDKLGSVFMKQAPFTHNEISVVIGVHGELNGHVIYTMDEKSGLLLASKIMAGFEVTGLDDMSKSAIKEIGNMISGNAASALFSHGFTVDITTPTYVASGETAGLEFLAPDSKLICIPIFYQGEQIFEVDLHFKA